MTSKYNAFKDKHPQYNFKIEGTTAIGTLPDGTTFKIDADMVETVSHYFFHLNYKGYVYTLPSLEKRRPTRLHWLVMGYTSNPPFMIDHINRDKTDCRRCNLRIVTNQQNSMNRPLGKNNRSGYLGVYFCNTSQRYKSKICISGHIIYLLTSDDKIACAQAYNYAADLLFREYRGYQNPVPEAPPSIKSIVDAKCAPYLQYAILATQNQERNYA